MSRLLSFRHPSSTRASLDPAPGAAKRSPLSPVARIAICLLLVAGAAGSVGCGTRTRGDRIIDRYGLEVELRSERKLFGPAVDHGYAHPSNISVERLQIILGSLQIERSARARTTLAPAIPAEILVPVSQGLAQAFREADSTQRIAVMAQRKQMQKMIFDRQFLTSFVAWIEGDELIFHLSRSDWLIEERAAEVKRRRPLPRPGVDEPQQKFRMVTNRYVKRAGRTGVAVDWRSDVFKDFTAAAAALSVPAPASREAGKSGEKTILSQEPPEALPPLEPLTNDQLGALSPADLRSLADLDESRNAGRITEAEYRQNRQAIIDAATAD